MKLRIEVEISDEQLAAFVGYYQIVYGKKPRPFAKKLRSDLELALYSRLEHWQQTVFDDQQHAKSKDQRACHECGDLTGCCQHICQNCDDVVPIGTCNNGYCEECCDRLCTVE